MSKIDNIGQHVVISASYNRTMCSTIWSAILHAKELFKRDAPPKDGFYIVEIVRYVTREEIIRTYGAKTQMEMRLEPEPEPYDPNCECFCRKNGEPHTCGPYCGRVPFDAVRGRNEGGVYGWQWKRGGVYYWINASRLVPGYKGPLGMRKSSCPFL